jgi:hypothetical protein
MARSFESCHRENVSHRRVGARSEAEDPWVAPIVEWLDENPGPFTLHELMVGALRHSESDADRFKNRVAALLHRLGDDRDRKRVSATRLRVWATVDTTD